VRQQHGAGWGQSDLSRVSFEQLKAQFGFQSLDPLRESRLGHVEALGGASEMARGGDLYECPELAQFHRWLDYADTVVW
jgi:hypothetical protein